MNNFKQAQIQVLRKTNFTWGLHVTTDCGFCLTAWMASVCFFNRSGSCEGMFHIVSSAIDLEFGRTDRKTERPQGGSFPGMAYIASLKHVTDEVSYVLWDLSFFHSNCFWNTNFKSSISLEVTNEKQFMICTHNKELA